ncbi:MAG TPA: hypothetical protein DDZ51_08550 [Planctomycetaceae bacterium]|nr:hypothetical protein [Planctomycetaceae bacterium]
MLAEMISKIAELTLGGVDFKAHPLPGGREVLVRQPDGTVTRESIPAADRNYAMGDLDSFSMMMNEADNGIVFVEPGTVGRPLTVTAFYNEDDRREFVSWTIQPSQPLLALLSLGTWSKQKIVVELIRDKLFDCVPADLLAQLRSIDFSRRNDGSRSIEHGRESLGCSVEMAVQTKRGELPEVFEISLPWYATDPVSEAAYRLSVTLDLDAMSESIRLVVRGDELESCNQQALRMVRDSVDLQLNDGGGTLPVVIGVSR